MSNVTWHWQTGCGCRKHWGLEPYGVKEHTAQIEAPFGPWFCTVVHRPVYDQALLMRGIKVIHHWARSGVRMELTETRKIGDVWQVPGRTLFIRCYSTWLVSERKPWEFARDKLGDPYLDNNGRPNTMISPGKSELNKLVSVYPWNHRFGIHIVNAVNTANESYDAYRQKLREEAKAESEVGR